MFVLWSSMALQVLVASTTPPLHLLGRGKAPTAPLEASSLAGPRLIAVLRCWPVGAFPEGGVRASLAPQAETYDIHECITREILELSQ